MFGNRSARQRSSSRKRVNKTHNRSAYSSKNVTPRHNKSKAEFEQYNPTKTASQKFISLMKDYQPITNQNTHLDKSGSKSSFLDKTAHMA